METTTSIIHWDLWKISATVGGLLIATLYFRYRFLARTVGIRFSSIGMGHVSDLRNSQLVLDKDLDLSRDDIQLASSGGGRHLWQFNSATVSVNLFGPVKSWLSIRVDGVRAVLLDSSGGHSSNNRSLSGDIQSDEDVQRALKRLLTVERILQVFGLLGTPRFAVGDIIVFPFLALLRAFCFWFVSSLVTVDILDIRVRVLDVRSGVDIKVKCDAVKLTSRITSGQALMAAADPSGPKTFLYRLFVSPRAAISALFKLEVSNRVLSFRVGFKVISVSARILALEDGVDDSSTYACCLRMSEKFLLTISMGISRHSRILMAPKIHVELGGLCVYLDVIHDIQEFLLSREVFQSPLSNVIPSDGDVRSLNVIKLETEVKHLTDLLIFRLWQADLVIRDISVHYQMNSQQEERFLIQFGRPKNALRRKLSFIEADDELTPSARFDVKLLEMRVESEPMAAVEDKKRKDSRSRDGLVKFHTLVNAMSFTLPLANLDVPSIYQLTGKDKPLSLSHLGVDCSLPYNLLALAMRHDEVAKSDFPIGDVTVIADSVKVAGDVIVLPAFLQSILPLHFQASPKSSTENSTSKSTMALRDILPKFSFDIKFALSDFDMIVGGRDVLQKETETFACIVADAKTIECEAHWDRHQRPSSGRRPSLNDSVSFSQFYLSTHINWQELNVRTYSANRGATPQPFNLAPCLFRVPLFSFSVSATIPSSAFSPSMTLPPASILAEVKIESDELQVLLHPMIGFTGDWCRAIVQHVESFKTKSHSVPADKKPPVSFSLGGCSVSCSVRVKLRNWAVVLGSETYGSRASCISLEEFDSSNTLHLDTNLHPTDVSQMEGNVLFRELHYSFYSSIEDLKNRQMFLRMSRAECVLESANLDSRDALGIFFSIEEIGGIYGLFPHLLMWHCVMHTKQCLECFTPFNNTPPHGRKPSISRRKLLDKIAGKFFMNTVDVTLLLPNGIDSGILIKSWITDLQFAENHVVTRVDRVSLVNSRKLDIFRLDGMSMMLKIRPPAGHRHEIFLKMESFIWSLPNKYRFKELIDNMANFAKTMKQLHSNGTTNCPEIPKDPTPSSTRRSHFQLIPTVHVNIVKLEIILEDDQFDSSICRLLYLGFEEQNRRTERNAAMESYIDGIRKSIDEAEKADQRFPEYRRNLLRPDRVQKAYDMLGAVNSLSWIQLIKKQGPRPPLLHVTMNNISLTISPPILRGETIEETITAIDPEMKAGTRYDLLFAFQLDVEIKGVTMQLRDFPKPLFEAPKEIAKVSGLLIFGEALKDIVQQSRKIQLPVSEIGNLTNIAEIVTIYRTIIPMMVFMSMDIEMPKEVTHVTFGTGFEPHLADMNRIFATLTPPSVDPSEPLPFWDKMRMMVHGDVHVKIPKGGAFRLRLSGSRRAHDPGHGPSAGIDLILHDEVSIDVGINGHTDDNKEGTEFEEEADYDRPPIRVCAGEVVVAIPSGGYGGLKDEIVARLSGGFQLGLRFDFETIKAGSSHANVFTRAPVYCIAPSGQLHDSYAGVRSKSITVNAFLTAPMPDSLIPEHGRNYLLFSHHVIQHFMQFSQTYTSPLTVLPIKRGKIHYPPPLKPPANQKLSRYIKGVNIQMHIQNLLAGYAHNAETYSLGLRANVNEISLALSLQQENFIPGRKGAGWELIAADYDMSDLEIRAFSRGNFDDSAEEVSENGSMESLSGVDLNSAETDDEWKFLADADFDLHDEPEIQLPFLRAPRLIYFRHGSHSEIEFVDPVTGESKIPDRDVTLMQLSLLQDRLQQIELEMQTDEETMSNWEARINLFQDDELAGKSLAIRTKLVIYKQKKAGIEKRMFEMKKQVEDEKSKRNRRSQPHLRNLSVVGTHFSRLSTSLSPAHARKASTFSLRSQANGQVKRVEYLHRFFIHNLAVLWTSKLRNLMFKFVDLESSASSVAYFVKHNAIRILREMIQDAAQKGSRGQKGTPMESETTPTAVNELLEHLLGDRGENLVVNEESHDDDKISKDPSDPRYVSPEFFIYHEMLIQCFYPQFNFQTTGLTGVNGAIVVAAESANMKSSLIMDETGEQQLVKTRRVIYFENAQFYSVFKDDLFAKLGKLGTVQVMNEIPWPVWVPTENLIDSVLPTEEFSKFVLNSRVIIQLDHCSPVYFRSDAPSLRKTTAGISSDAYELEHVNSTHVNFPKLVFSATSNQYCAMYDIICNLMVYNDPTRKKRNDNVRTVLFALLKEKDLGSIIEFVYEMQEKIRRLERIWQLNLNRIQTRKQVAIDDDFAFIQAELRSRIDSLLDELLLVMQALKRIASQKQNEDSIKRSSRTIVHSDELRWKLIAENNNPLCEVLFTGANYYTLSYEDRSNMHNIEINKLTMSNLLPKPYFTELFSPYLPDGRELDFERHKMLRVYWREMAPVAGISIIDHFEINIFPLLLQGTYDVGKGLIEYLYPKTISASASSNPSSAPPPSAPRGRSRAATMNSASSSRPRSDSLESGDSGGSSSILRTFTRSHSNLDLAEDTDAKLMKDRASNNKTFIYIKVPGSTHCISYHGEKDKNIEDLYRFVLKLPNLEYHNRTWSWLEFLMAVRKDIAFAVFSQTGSLVREKLMMRKRPKKVDKLANEDGDADEE